MNTTLLVHIWQNIYSKTILKLYPWTHAVKVTDYNL